MPAKCAKEKKALEKAKNTLDRMEGTYGEWEAEVERDEALYQKTISDIFSTDGCIDSEGRLDWECVADSWKYAEKLLESLVEDRKSRDFWGSEFDQALIDEENREEEYCACREKNK